MVPTAPFVVRVGDPKTGVLEPDGHEHPLMAGSVSSTQKRDLPHPLLRRRLRGAVQRDASRSCSTRALRNSFPAGNFGIASTVTSLRIFL
jgi:hypothetical protein